MLARTDPDAPKHKGITFLLVPMDQPGVEVRPIKMISGDSEFNEVFFTDARCPKDERRRRGEQRLGRRHDAARLRAGRGGGHDARSCSGPSSTGCSALAREHGVADDPLDPPAPGVVPLARSRSCATSACAR